MSHESARTADRSLARWRLAAYALTTGGLGLNATLTVLDLERWWDRGPVLRAIGLVALVLSAASVGFTLGVHLFARWVRHWWGRA